MKHRHAKTNLTLEQFETLAAKVRALDEARKALESAIIDCVGYADQPTMQFLAAALNSVSQDVPVALLPYWWQVQPEWTGGDSMDPKNTDYREPHIVDALLKR